MNPEILIVCAAASHPTKVSKIERFYLPPVAERARGEADDWALGGLDGWIAISPQFREQNLQPDNTPAPQPTSFAPGSRKRFRFECPLCGMVKTVRGERLVPILDRARHAQIAELPLDLF